MKRSAAFALLVALGIGCSPSRPAGPAAGAGYFDQAGRDDVLGGGVRLIPIHTARGEFHVWTRRVGNNPTLKVLLLVDEVEQVRKALGLGRDNFVLFGHSWGGILAIEYALAHPAELKGLVISDMMSSIPAYNEYAGKVLMPEMDPKALMAGLIRFLKDVDAGAF